jgi:hypothetical protein
MAAGSTSPRAVYPLLEHSLERYPLRWYENTPFLIAIAAAMAAIPVGLHSQLSLPVSPGAWASGLAVVGWMAVWFVDVVATGLIGAMKVEFDRRGLEPFGEERNPLSPCCPTWRDLVVNWTNAGSLALSVFFWFVPLLAVVSVAFRGASFWRIGAACSV